MSNMKVWSKFSVVAKNGTTMNLRIMDMPKHLSEVVAKLYLNYFVKEESFLKASGVPKSAEALEEMKGLLAKITKDDAFHIAICCLDNDDEQMTEVVGASMMTLTLKDAQEPKRELKTPELKKLMKIFYGLSLYFDEAKEFNLDRYYADRGLFVCPDYRGLGIAQEFLKVRRIMCKEHGIPINGAWMTSYGTQKAAERDGWETVYELQYADLDKEFGVTFDKEPPSSKFMIARIN